MWISKHRIILKQAFATPILKLTQLYKPRQRYAFFMKTELRNPKNGIFMQPNPKSPFYARKRSKSGNNFNAIKIKKRRQN